MLTKMDAVGSQSQRYIYPIVDYNSYAALASDGQRLFGLFVKLARWQMFLTQLNYAGTALAELDNLFSMRQS
jgi:hypothetical protein